MFVVFRVVVVDPRATLSLVHWIVSFPGTRLVGRLLNPHEVKFLIHSLAHPRHPPSTNRNEVDTATSEAFVGHQRHESIDMRPPGCGILTLALLAIKCLLGPAYRSTDYHVHRSWMAITHTAPWQTWYRDNRTQWTLDYPPFFAWWERFRAIPAAWIEPNLLKLEGDGMEDVHESTKAIAYQRGTVMMAETLVLASGAWYFAKAMRSEGKSNSRKDSGIPSKACTDWTEASIAMGLVGNAGLILVDHIHFQFNGMLLGVLVWSLAFAQSGKNVLSAICFAVLLQLKHLFAYAAPIYFVFLLKRQCKGKYALQRFFLLAAAVSSVTVVSVGPFLWAGQGKAMLGRLFPFGRGLMHAYWAPNFWALYASTDKVCTYVVKKLWRSSAMQEGHLARGLVGVQEFAVLPNITPGISGSVVLLAMVPCLISLWRSPTRRRFLAAVGYSYLCGFMFGYHVHEKAVLHFLVIYAMHAATSSWSYEQFLLMSKASYYSLMPLLFTTAEAPIKVLLVEVLHFVHLWFLQGCHGKTLPFGQWNRVVPTLSIVFGLLQTYNGVLHKLVFGGKMPFLPLMLQSTTSSLVLFVVWLREMAHWMRGRSASSI